MYFQFPGYIFPPPKINSICKVDEWYDVRRWYLGQNPWQRRRTDNQKAAAPNSDNVLKQ